MSIQAIIFDLDETLITDDEATYQALERVGEFAYRQVEVDAELLARTAYAYAQRMWSMAPIFPYCEMLGISASEGLWGRFGCDNSHLQALYDWVPSYQHETWRYALAKQNVDDDVLAERLAALFRQQRRACQRLFPETLAVLQSLQPIYKLALLTNGAPDLQREKIQHFQLAPSFEEIIVSGEIGVGKPQPTIFNTMLEHLAVAPPAVVMVGDSLERDIRGAYQAGLKSIWINRQELPCEPEYRALMQAEIATLKQLPAVIQHLR
jgi:phosphoserine phosphatase